MAGGSHYRSLGDWCSELWARVVDSAGNGNRNERPLNGWREIASYFGRNQSTVKRWAAQRGLPVHRLAGEQARKGVAVHAYPSELDRWLASGRRDDDTAADAEAINGASVAISESAAPEALPALAPEPPRFTRRAPPLLLAGVLAGVLAISSAIGVAVHWLPSAASQDEQTAQSNIPEDAREFYLRGTWLWNKRTPEGIAGAIDALERAVEIHPDYAEAYAGLAMTYNLARQYGGMSGWEAYPKAKDAAERAVELDPTLDLAQSALAFVEFHWLWQVDQGLSRFEEALRLNPDSANTLMWYGSSLLHAGRYAEALPAIEKAQVLEPENRAILMIKAQALFYNGHVGDAVAMLRQMIELEPDYAWSHFSLMKIQAVQGDYPGYLESYARMGDLLGNERYRQVAERGREALVEGGVSAMVEAMVAVEKDYYEKDQALAWDIARHYAMIGNAREAIPWLHVSLEAHEERLIGLILDTAFWPIRNHPEFQQIVVEVGLPTA